MNIRRAITPGPAALLSVALLCLGALSQHESFDLMFSLATGRWILDHGFPPSDPFSQTAAHAWFLQSWLYCVAMAKSVDWFGGQGPAIVMGLLLAGFALLILRILRLADGQREFSALIALILIMATQDYALGAERSYHAGNLLFAGLVWLMLAQDRRAGRICLWAIPLTALWSNVHGSWATAPALLSAAALGSLLDGRARWRSAGWLALAACGSLVAAVLNPEGFSTLAYPLRLVIGARGHDIAEWHAWSLASGPGQALAILFIWTAWTVWRSGLRQWRFLLPGLGLIAGAVIIERFSVLAGLWLAVTLFAHRSEKTPAFGPAVTGADGRVAWTGRAGQALSAAWARLNVIFGRLRDHSGSLLWPILIGAALLLRAALVPLPLSEVMDRRLFPVRSIQILCAQTPGRVLNTYRLGGAISALCGPEFKVFIDGREEPFPERVHEDYRRLALFEDGWRRVLATYDPDYVIWSRVRHGGALADWLTRSDEFRALHEDPLGSLWVRLRPEPKTRRGPLE